MAATLQNIRADDYPWRSDWLKLFGWLAARNLLWLAVQAFSYDGQAQTIRTKDRSKEKSIGRVYLKELSFTDVKVVNEMYSCSGEWFS